MNQTLFSPLSLSQLLKSKGVKQESMFKWHSKVDENGKLSHTEIIYFPIDPLSNDYSAFTLSELPDVFRQVFDDEAIDKGTGRTEVEVCWDWFTHLYLQNPNHAWETLEKTIRELK